MPALRGTDTPWKDHPTWPCRYDFATKVQPSLHLHNTPTMAIGYTSPIANACFNFKSSMYYKTFLLRMGDANVSVSTAPQSSPVSTSCTDRIRFPVPWLLTVSTSSSSIGSFMSS